MRPLSFTCFLLLTLARATAGDVTFQLTDAKGAPVADAVVSLVSLDAPAPPAPPAAPLEIVQTGQEFSPLVTPVVVGTTVVFPNRDTVGHQVYSLSKPTKQFTLPIYQPGNSGTVVFDQPGVVAIGCNIHAWMLSYVVVLETPWFAKAAANGRALVASVPPGRYRAEVWHPTLKMPETREIAVADGTALVAFKLAATPIPRLRRAPTPGGGGYK